VKAITVRNVPLDLARLIRKKAKVEGTSLSRTVMNLLRENFNPPKRTRYRDLGALAGSWTRQQATEFDEHLAKQRQIDRELWK